MKLMVWTGETVTHMLPSEVRMSGESEITHNVVSLCLLIIMTRSPYTWFDRIPHTGHMLVVHTLESDHYKTILTPC